MGLTGYHAKGRANSRKRYHTDRGCQQLTGATNVVGVDVEEDEPYCGDDWGECRFCSGEYEPGTSGNGLRNKLASPDFGPEDLGLSPVGERADD